jgi:hypothetical protein
MFNHGDTAGTAKFKKEFLPFRGVRRAAVVKKKNLLP